MNHELVKVLFNLTPADFSQKISQSAVFELKQVLDLFLCINGQSISLDKIDFSEIRPYFISTRQNPGPQDSAISVNGSNMREKLEATAAWITPMTYVSIFSIIESYLLGIREHIDAYQVRKSVYDYLLSYYQNNDSTLRALVPDKYEGILVCLTELKKLNTPRNKFAHRRKANGEKHEFSITLPETLQAWLSGIYIMVVIDDLLSQEALHTIRNGS